MLNLVDFVIFTLVTGGVGLNGFGVELQEHWIFRFRFDFLELIEDVRGLLLQYIYVFLVEVLENDLFAVLINSIDRLHDSLHTVQTDALQVLKLLLELLGLS